MVMRPEDLVRGVDTVASVKQVYDRLFEVMDHPLSSATDIGRVIGEDPGLTARLLRLVNSPLYGFPTRISEVSHAVSVVGMVQLNDLALGTTFIHLFDNVPCELVDMESFWEHSVACGVCARILATERREPNVERYFVAGLLHDIGRPIMFLNAPDESRVALERARNTGELLVRVEADVFGFHHATVGATLLERWRVPRTISDAVAWHHQPALASRFPQETAVVHLADIMANALRLGSSGEHLVPPLAPAAWDRIGLSPATVPELLRQAEQHYRATLHAIVGVAA